MHDQAALPSGRPPYSLDKSGLKVGLDVVGKENRRPRRQMNPDSPVTHPSACLLTMLARLSGHSSLSLPTHYAS